MGSINRVILIGRLGRDPDARTTAGGTQVSNFTLATNLVRNDNGARREITEWHRVVAFGKLAEQCNHYLCKGRLVCIEGSLQTRSWEKPAGEKHFSTEIIAARVTFLDSKASGSSPQGELIDEGEVETVEGI